MTPFRVSVPDEALADVRARLHATRWPEPPLVDDWSLGPSLAFVRSLCEHWAKGFDWRALEARINAVPNYLAELDGITLHFVDQPAATSNPIPLLLLHGWPSSFLEFLDLVASLATGQPAFHVVLPSLPGYGWSTTRPQLSVQRVARLLAELMTRLGHARFMIQGANWGALIGMELARQFPERVLGLHLNSVNGSAPPDADTIPLSETERGWVADHARLLGFPHFGLLSQRPFSAAYALLDSPAGLAAWVGEKLHDWEDRTTGPGLPLDWMVGTIALYWHTRSIGTSHMLYHEMVRDRPAERYVAVPTAAAVFRQELVKIPRGWAERHYNIVQWTEYDRGGHFAAVETPDLLLDDLRRFARLLDL